MSCHRGWRPRAAVALLLVPLALVGCSRPHAASPSVLPPRVAQVPVRVGQAQAAAVLADPPTNIVICVLDAARADHMGCYGYPRNTTPNIDRLARESVLFRNHFCTVPATMPSTASLLTGLHADTHLALDRIEIAPGTFTLEEGLARAGLRTALFTSNVNASPERGVGADFQRIYPKWVSLRRAAELRADSSEDRTWQTPEVLTQAFTDWLGEVGSARFFAYLHLLPPHEPYAAPAEHARAVATVPARPAPTGRYEFPETAPSYPRRYPALEWVEMYDANMRWGDWGVGEVVHALRERNLLDNTLLIVTADHGEAFGEHGYLFHCLSVYDEGVHIPLLIRFPGRQRLVGQVEALTQTVDLLPTVLDLTGGSFPKQRVQGVSLRPVLEGREGTGREYVFSRSGGRWPQYLVRDSRWALVRYSGGKLKALYDLRRDPAEAQNMAATHPEVVAKLTAALTAFGHTQTRPVAEFTTPGAAPPAMPKAPARPLSNRAKRELKALGYVD